MGSANMLFIVRSLQYKRHYDAIITNITNITTVNGISGYVKPTIDATMWDIVAGKKPFEEGNQYEILDDVTAMLTGMMEATDSEKGAIKLAVILRTLDTLTHYIDLLGEQTARDARVAENEAVLENVRGVSELVEEMLQEYMLFEVNRSELKYGEVQRSITAGCSPARSPRCRLWPFPSWLPLSVMAASWAEETLAESANWIDVGLVQAGLRLFEELPRTAPTDVLLATDLHAGNVLSAQREPWLVIDPKPFVGDPAYDATQHLLNCRARMQADPHATIRGFADLLEIDEERIRLWMFVRYAAESNAVNDADTIALARSLMG